MTGVSITPPESTPGAAMRAARQRQWSWARAGVLVAVIVVACALPFYFSPVTNEQLTRLLVLSIAILSLNLLAGFSGQISVGQGAFAGLGAYTSAILVSSHGWAHLPALAAAALLCLVAGLIAGLPALRIRGLYLALVTLSLAVVFPTLIDRFTSITGGSAGLSVPQFSSPFGGLAQDQWAYLLALAFAVVIFLLVRNLTRSRVGRALIASRDNEIAAQTVGMAVGRYRVLVFGISASLAGIAGSLLIMTAPLPFVDPSTYTLTFSIYLLVGTVVGGAVSFVGPFIGAVFIDRVPAWIANQSSISPKLTPAIFGGLLIALMFLAPGGVVGLYEQVKVAVLRRLGRAPTHVGAADAAFASATHVAAEMAATDADRSADVTSGVDPDAPEVARKFDTIKE
jgi:branched-chain amino acid transport system permease protein